MQNTARSKTQGGDLRPGELDGLFRVSGVVCTNGSAELINKSGELDGLGGVGWAGVVWVNGQGCDDPP